MAKVRTKVPNPVKTVNRAAVSKVENNPTSKTTAKASSKVENRVDYWVSMWLMSRLLSTSTGRSSRS